MSKLDPKVLGQLLLMQAVVVNIPENKTILDFVVKGLSDIPGVYEVDCKSNDDSKNKEFDHKYKLKVEHYKFGTILVNTDDAELFKLYEPYILNFIFILSVILHERALQEEVRNKNKELEIRVEERTKELLEKNDEIETQNEEYYALNEELNEHNLYIEKVNKQLEVAKLRAEESDRLKSAFLSNMSHEIRTPLNGIIGFARLLSKPAITKAKQTRFIQLILDSGKRMLSTINDIMDISKIEAGQATIKVSEVNINEQLKYMETLFRLEAQDRGLRLSYHTSLEKETANIKVDKEKFIGILINLIKNAIKYTKEGFIEFGYSLKKNEKEYLEFYVKDTGIGIEEEFQEKIFDRFVQANMKADSGYEGTGLGLSITKSYVELLGGEISVSSEIDKGSCFYFTLPYETA